MKIVIAGGSGQVGTLLARHFRTRGNEVVVLSRHPYPAAWQVSLWDGQTTGPWTDHLEGSDVCINLSGQSVNCRYNQKNRKLIYDSRVNSTRLLNRTIARLRRPPSLWINASTATIYRHALDRPMDDVTGELGGAEPGAPDTWNFSIDVAKACERAFFEFAIPNTRKVAIRSSMIFSPDRGGVFDVFLSLVRHGFGGHQGEGNQYVSWVHDFDFTAAIDFLVARTELSGTVNIASPNPLTNAEFLKDLREAWGTGLAVSAPGWLVELGTALLRTESELVLKSRRVIPTRLQDAGFGFAFPQWRTAASDLVERWRAGRTKVPVGCKINLP